MLKNYNELSNIFDLKIDKEVISELEVRYDRAQISSFLSRDLMEVVKVILRKEEFNSVLSPAFNLGTMFSWMEDYKKIVGYEHDYNLYNMSRRIWECKEIDLVNENFILAPISKRFDAIVFTTPCGWEDIGIGQKVRLEREYINKSLDLLNDNGILIVNVPSSVLRAPLWKETRNRIVSDFSLEMVIYYDKMFENTGINWYTLVINKNTQRDNIYFPEYKNNFEEIINNYELGTGEFWVDKDELGVRWDRNYLHPKYSDLRKSISDKNTTKLGDIAEITLGVHFQREERYSEGDYLILSPSLIEDNSIVMVGNRYSFCKEESVTDNRRKNAILRENDIVISLYGDYKWYKHTDYNLKIIASQHMAIIRTTEKNSKNLEQFFKSETSKKYFEFFSSGRGILRVISISELRKFTVPTETILKIASKYSLESNTVASIADTFERAGWEVRYEQIMKEGAEKFIFDILLYHRGILKGAIEVRNFSYKDLSRKNRLLSQFDSYKNILNIESIFLFVESDLFLYKDGDLVRLPDIPSPNFESINNITDIYIEDFKDEDSIIVKDLPDNLLSLSDRFLLEQIWKTTRETRKEVADIHKIVKDIAQQITSYQSLIKRQIDRAIELEEIERIMQSFVDECTEKIVQEFNQKYTEGEYKVEENKLRVSLGEFAWNKLDESSQTFLISSKLMYNKLISMGNVVDYSGVCLLVTKALEVEMSNRFCIKYIAYLNSNYPGKANLDNWPIAMKNRYGSKLRSKDFTLGNVAYVLCYKFAQDITEEQKSNNLAKLLEFSKNEIFEDKDDDEILNCLYQYAEWIEDIRTDYRNPSAHTGELKKVDAENCFDLVTDVEKVLKVMLDSFKA